MNLDLYSCVLNLRVACRFAGNGTHVTTGLLALVLPTCTETAKETMCFVVRAGGKEKDIGWAVVGAAIAKLQCPETLNRDRLTVGWLLLFLPSSLLKIR